MSIWRMRCCPDGLGLLAVFAGWFIVATIIGAVHQYSPVPQADLWVTFDFYSQAQHWNAWWAQHNEHRIVLARLFFWINFTLWKGELWFLLGVNYVLAACSCLVFGCFIQGRVPQVWDKKTSFYLCCGVVAWLFTWAQHENFLSGFQSQFFLAQLLPLAACYFLYRTATQDSQHSEPCFWAAFACGVLSVGSMANGVMALPLMTLYAYWFRFTRGKVIGLLSAAITMGVLYGYHYVSPPYHQSLLGGLLHTPWQVFRYLVLYMGSALYHLIPIGRTMAYVCGSLFLIGLLHYVYREGRRCSAWSGALLLFILYILLTALITAAGRSFLGMNQAFASRYVTPSAMAWAALLILYVDWIASVAPLYSKYIGMFCFAWMMAMVPMQYGAFHHNDQERFERKIAGLALEMQVNDPVAIQATLLPPPSDQVLPIAKRAMEQGLSFTGNGSVLYQGDPALGSHVHLLSRRLCKQRQPMQHDCLPRCAGFLEKSIALKKAPHWIRVEGWILEPASRSIPKKILILNPQAQVIGYALSGKMRQDLKPQWPAHALRPSGFVGYMKDHESIGWMMGTTPDCILEVSHAVER